MNDAYHAERPGKTLSRAWTSPPSRRSIVPFTPVMLTGLVGPDGAGKTTLMRMLAGLLKPDSGNATVIGFDPIQNDGALHAVLGYMPQKIPYCKISR